jgi:hypothetical protein
MVIRDLFSDWEGPGALVPHNGVAVLTLEASAIPSDQTWFLRIVEATADERKAIDEAGYLLKDA